MTILFESDRLYFTKLSIDDFEYFCEMDLDPKVMKFYTSRPHGTIEAAQESFQRYIDYQVSFPRLGGFLAFNKQTNEFVGLGVLIHLELNPLNNQYEVGYRLPVRSWNQGYATEMCKRLITYGFQVLGFEEIHGTTHPDHKISQKVLLKCGLKEIGSSSNYGGSTVFCIQRE